MPTKSTYQESFRGRQPKYYKAASADRVKIQRDQAKSPRGPAPGRPLSPSQLVREYVLAERENNRGGFRTPSGPPPGEAGSFAPRATTPSGQYVTMEEGMAVTFSSRINDTLGPSGTRPPSRPLSPSAFDPPPAFTSLVDYVGPNWTPPTYPPAPPPSSRPASAAVPRANGEVWTKHVPRPPTVANGAVTSGGAWSFKPRPPASAKPGRGVDVPATPLMPPYAPPPRCSEPPAGGGESSFAPPFPPGVPYMILAVPQPQQPDSEEGQGDEQDQKEEEERRPEPHWSVWVDNTKKVSGTPPLPPKLKPRPHTSTGIRPPLRPAPAAPPTESQPFPVYVLATEQGPARGSPVTYVPELQSWTNASTDYEKEAAARIAMYRSSSLDRGLTSLNITPRAPPYMPYRSMTHWGGFPTDIDPRTHYAQSMLPYAGAAMGGPREDRIIRSMARNMSGADPMPSMGMLTARRESRPRARHGHRGHRPVYDDYVHDLSCFTSTAPMTSGYYIIHPDWVSERLTLRRAASMQALNA